MCFLCHTKEKYHSHHCLSRQKYWDNDEKFMMYLNCIEPPHMNTHRKLSPVSYMLNINRGFVTFPTIFLFILFFFHSISLSQLQILIFWWPALIIPFCFRANLVWSKAAWRMHDLIWNVLASCRNTYLKCIPAKLRQENPKFETSLGSIVISNPVWSSLKIYIPLLNKPTAQLVCAVQ